MNKVDYLLVCLMEECAEVQHACAKALRFGLDDHHPSKGMSNVEDLMKELDDVYAIVALLQDEGIELDGSLGRIIEKKAKVSAYMKYSEERGKLE